MRTSQWPLATLKETPADAEISSHQLMLRAGMIRKLGSGLYIWLPLGLKILRQVEQIVREEMNRAGALEILMPAVQPAELWQETGRWQAFGDQLLTMKDNNDRNYCFGPTHEEVVTDLMRHELHSYKQLPMNVYQIQTKFRDEIRPRFGVMRAREFIMKDAYSFHLDSGCLQQTYNQMYQAYCHVFDRLGLRYRAVEADTGAIGGAVSHEFQVLAEAGEDLIFYSDSSDYAANAEQATSKIPLPTTSLSSVPLSIVDTPSQKSIEDIATFLQLKPEEIAKTLIVHGKEHPFVALVLRGDDELNPIKAAKHPLIKSPLTMASDVEIQNIGRTTRGFIGPIGLPIPIIVDHYAHAMPQFVCGANKNGQHYIHATWGRDIYVDNIADLRTVKEGDVSPDGKGTLRCARGIEVGHIFQLGDKYAKAMHATVLNEDGKLQTMLMGCYGLGISRIVAAAIEQHHDDKGILWPKSLAPFQVVIIPLNMHRSKPVEETSEQLYSTLKQAGIDVLLDDRNERAGALFADHDLIGIPYRLVISERLLIENQVEYKARNEKEPRLLKITEVLDAITAAFEDV